MTQKPLLNNKQIWNINFGFLGLQICLTLILANTSRILSGLGADIDQLPLLWLAPPLAGLIIQPIVGYMSDVHGLSGADGYHMCWQAQL